MTKWNGSRETWLTKAIDNKSYSSWEEIAAAFSAQFGDEISAQSIKFRWQNSIRCTNYGYHDPFPVIEEHIYIPNNHETNLRAIRTADTSRSTQSERWTEHQTRWLEANMSRYPTWEDRAAAYNNSRGFSRKTTRTARGLERKWRNMNRDSDRDDGLSQDYFYRADRYDGRDDRDEGYAYYD